VPQLRWAFALQIQIIINRIIEKLLNLKEAVTIKRLIDFVMLFDAKIIENILLLSKEKENGKVGYNL
jgi:hypothetical protein